MRGNTRPDATRNPAALLNRRELAALVDPGYSVIARTARKPWRCRAADPYRPGWWVRVTLDGGEFESPRPDRQSAGSLAADYRNRHPDAVVEVYQKPNPDHRADCLGDIPPGTAYVEYLGGSAGYEHGHPYCQRCGVAVWGTGSTR